ncbi:MAG TPA: hypothetical protein EYG76_01310 [Methanothermococcus okinawensis]|uniref:Uncharacterized protein n=1 Tax=Methanothermococcus okinawensis TaxID=155863 RepID=A0A833DRA5_9EURY|nr:hypothetical protein [Methanothermococcus okinawensis]
MMEGDFVIHLVSSASRNLYPANTADGFTNHLHTPIYLDPNTNYEVALLNIYMPKDYFALIKDDYESRIEVYKVARNSEGTMESNLFYTYIPDSNIATGDMKYLLTKINMELHYNLGQLMDGKHIFRLPLFKWNPVAERVIINNTYKIKEQPQDDTSYYIKLGSRLAHILGYSMQNTLPIGIPSNPESTQLNYSPNPPQLNAGIQYVVVYTDIIEPTHFGDQMVNVLDVFAIGPEGNRGFHNVIYKPLKSNLISDISIKLTDQIGRRILFSVFGDVTCTLHIRKKI